MMPRSRQNIDANQQHQQFKMIEVDCVRSCSRTNRTISRIPHVAACFARGCGISLRRALLLVLHAARLWSGNTFQRVLDATQRDFLEP
eukprot:SAG11_NODE_8240_length_1042_cov_1.219512_1_plen_87_part_10